LEASNVQDKVFDEDIMGVWISISFGYEELVLLSVGSVAP